MPAAIDRYFAGDTPAATVWHDFFVRTDTLGTAATVDYFSRNRRSAVHAKAES
jgi:hypothetical protein